LKGKFFIKIVFWLRHPAVAHQDFHSEEFIELLRLIKLLFEIGFVSLLGELFPETLVKLGAYSLDDFLREQDFEDILSFLYCIFLPEIILLFSEGRSLRLAELWIERMPGVAWQ
jgi:hypothetical protein